MQEQQQQQHDTSATTSEPAPADATGSEVQPEGGSADETSSSPSIQPQGGAVQDVAATADDDAESKPAVTGSDADADGEADAEGEDAQGEEEDTAMQETSQDAVPAQSVDTSTPTATVKSEEDTPSTLTRTKPVADDASATVPSKTAPLQPASVKQEAMSEVNAFLAQMQADVAQAPTQDSAQPDLSTPAARREHLLARVEQEPRDAEAWLTLLADAEARLAEGDDATWGIDQVRETYDKFLAIYPHAAKQWQGYIDLELSLSNFAQVEQLFTRCLRSTPSVSLWKSYLSYTRRVNPLPAASSSEDGQSPVRKLIEDAYEFAVNHIGMSRDATEIWQEYIKFVKERDAKTPWLSGQKMDDLRRIYQRVVGIPISGVEQVWRDYDQFENGLNKVTAKKFLAERSAAYMTARSALREMRSLVDPLHRPLLPRLPVWVTQPSPDPAEVARDRQRLEAWKAYLEWEESDPLELTEIDRDSLKKRVDVAYAKATMHMRFYPEIWWMASRFAEKSGYAEEAVHWLTEGLKACPDSYLLGFARIEQAEARNQSAQAPPIFESLLANVHKKIDQLQKDLETSLARVDAIGAEARAEAIAAKRAVGDSDELEGEEREEERKRQDEREAEKESLRKATEPLVESLKEEASLVWIRWMHFVRRTEGLRPTRVIFSKARKSPHYTWQIFEASALMEYHCSKDPVVATKVFELALKTFGKDEAFVVRYLDFLISINDENNARALFERTISTFDSPERARPLWDRWAEYEYSFGDSASIRKLEARMAEAYPDESPLKRFVDRCSYMDLDVIGPRDLGVPSAFGGAGATAADRAVHAANVAAVGGGGESGTTASTAFGAGSAAAGLKRGLQGDGGAGWETNGGGVGGGDAHPSKRPRGESPSTTRRASPPASRRNPLPPQGSVFSGGPGPGPNVQGVALGAKPAMGGVAPQPQGMASSSGGGAGGLADPIMYFISLLPSVQAFDGPMLRAEDILEAVRMSSIQVPNGLAAGGGAGGWGRNGSVGGGGGAQAVGGGGDRRRRGGQGRRRH